MTDNRVDLDEDEDVALQEKEPLTPNTKEKKQHDLPHSRESTLLSEHYHLWEGHRNKVLALVSFVAFIGPISTTLYFPSVPAVMKDLQTTEVMIGLTFSVFMVVLGIGQLFWGTFSDKYGRRPTLIIGLTGTLIASILIGFSWNVIVMILFRVLQAATTSALLVVGSGAVADVFPPSIRGNAYGWYTLAPAVGPLFGPTIGGVIAEFLGWRWIFWGTAILVAVIDIIVIFAFKETLSDIKRTKTFDVLAPLRHLTKSSVVGVAQLHAIQSGLTFGVLVFLPIVLDEWFHLNQVNVGLSYLPYGFAALIGTSIGGKCSDYMAKNFGIGGRLVPSIISVFYLAVAFILQSVAVTYWVILLATALIGFTFCAQRPGVFSFCVEIYPEGAGGISALILWLQYTSNFIASTVGPIVQEQVRHGIFWYFLGSAAISLLSLIPCTFLCMKHWNDFRN